MTTLPFGILIFVGIAGSICVLAMMHVFASVIRHEVTLHDLRNRVERINNDYAIHLARQSGELSAQYEGVPVEQVPGQPEFAAADQAESNNNPQPEAGNETGTEQPANLGASAQAA